MDKTSIDKTRLPDIMGVYKESEIFQPYKTDDGWTVILPGEEDGRRKKYGKTLVAITSVEIKLSSAKELENCIKELEESDRRIRELSGGGDWDWRKVMIKDFTVRFGVAWYNKEFFEHRKEAWSNPIHAHIYAKFGATQKNFTVKHHYSTE